ncbi:hypothetical protein J5T34_20630 [Cupriavidus gilardii]|uniref:hypothetical protein n=1 Tax=Cupriavidus gilardii TaxID=82541 RepID=UPI001ABE605F|nr:hypothetical protein [Cupriavidus gilardii]MBO4123138.1 hypothetical protein [Cupriavidus gilardii]
MTILYFVPQAALPTMSRLSMRHRARPTLRSLPARIVSGRDMPINNKGNWNKDSSCNAVTCSG